MVPEQRHLLFKRLLRVDHPVDPVRLGRIDLPMLLDVHPVPVDHVVIQLRLVLRVQELLDRRLVPLLERRLKLLAPSPEASATEEVRHQLKICELTYLGTTNRHTRTSLANAGAKSAAHHLGTRAGLV